MPTVTTIDNAPRTRRRMRHPQHPFAIKSKPWGITPFFIAPVLAGETLKNLLLQSRVVSDPVKSRLIGWWQEYYFFYVKLRDLDGRNDFVKMLLDPSFSLYPTYMLAPASPTLYHAGNSISWLNMCVPKIVEMYFRYEGENVSDYVIGTNWFAAGINQTSVLDSLMNDDDVPTDSNVGVVIGADDTVTMSELDKARMQWEVLWHQGLTTQTYEDYLSTFGVRVPEEELHKPELIRFVRDWQYPTNHIDQTDGSATSALSWKVAERADKDRYFKEPGFIVGLSVTRPKVYLLNQAGTATGLMDNTYSWLPAILRDDQNAGMRKVPTGTGPFKSLTDDYWVDVKDLLLYGEQFVNDLALAELNKTNLPTAAGQKRYPSTADADGLFVTAGKDWIHQDGIVSLHIAGSIVETTPSTVVSGGAY